MTIGHSRLLSASDDTSIKKICTQQGTLGQGYLMVPLTPIVQIEVTQVGSGSVDDIQTMTLTKTYVAITQVSNNISGGFSIIVANKTVTGIPPNCSAAYMTTLLSQFQVTGIVVTGGDLGTNPLVFITASSAQSPIQLGKSTLEYKPSKWVPIVNVIDYEEVVTSSIYAATALWSQQSIWPDKTATSGTVVLKLQTYSGLATLPAIPFNCTAQQLLDAIVAGVSSSQLNPASYEVYGGPWPKPLTIQFKNTLQYQSILRFQVLTNSLNNGAVPQIFPTGKQLLVSYHPQLKKYIVVRPGYA